MVWIRPLTSTRVASGPSPRSDVEAAPGTPLLNVLDAGDVRLVVDVLPNRPDLLLHLGFAREAGGQATAYLAFELNREPDAVRQRYGMHPLGQNLLLARQRRAGVVAAAHFDDPGTDQTMAEQQPVHAPVHLHQVHPGQQVQQPHRGQTEAERKRWLDDHNSPALLVRPDQVVAWRQRERAPDCAAALRDARSEADASMRRTNTVAASLTETSNQLSASLRAIERGARRQIDLVDLIAELDQRAKK